MEHLLRLPVLLRGIRVGNVVDVILDADGERPLGLEVRCRDDRHRFLPMAAASERADRVVMDSPFALLDTDELEFYREHGVPLRSRREPAA